jgi:signal transduction histidine kinase
MNTPNRSAVAHVAVVAFAILCWLCGRANGDEAVTTAADQPVHYENQDTQDLVVLVRDAGKLVEADGEAAFDKLSAPGSRWRRDDRYIFVLDPAGKMLIHPDPRLQGKATMDLKDISGRPITRGLIDAATSTPGKTDGWYHYEWPVPDGLLPRWKSSYVRLAVAPSGKRFIVGSGMYNDRMERPFVVDMVKAAVAQIESNGTAAFDLLRDRKGSFFAKDVYVFVVDPNGVELVNPGFPNLEGRNLLDVKDTQGKPLVRELLAVAKDKGTGWVDYMWPKPGEAVSTQKSTDVTTANVSSADGKSKWLLAGAGVYLADAPKARPDPEKMTAPHLMSLVREGDALFDREGEAAYSQFRQKDSKWFRGETYFVVYTLDGIRTFHAPDRTLEGKDIRDDKGRPYGKMFLDVGSTPSGEGWVHYMYPEPGNIFPAWKSAFVKRVTAPSGKQYLIRSAVYNLQMDKSFIQDMVDRAAALVETQGTGAFN